MTNEGDQRSLKSKMKSKKVLKIDLMTLIRTQKSLLKLTPNILACCMGAMRPVIMSVVSLVLSCGLQSCYLHSQPTADSFILEEGRRGASAQVFVDANGTFYPSGWKGYPAMRDLKLGKGSLMNATVYDSSARDLILKDEVRQLTEVKRFARDKDRLFIFVHGFNNSAQEAEDSYDSIQDMIAFGEADGVLKFLALRQIR